MQTLHTTARAGDDGVLHFDLPIGSAGMEYEVVVILQPKGAATPTIQPGQLPWRDFIEQTAGRWEGEFVRDQGHFEERDPL